MATRKPRRFGEGGETADKEEGLKASKDEKVGFFERMRMGNIDDPNSEAYRRFGAGRGKAERTPVEDRVATPVKREEPKAEKEDDKPSKAMRERAEDQGKKQDSGDASVAEMYQGARKEPVKSESKAPAKAPAKAAPKAEAKPAPKASPKMQEQTYTRKSGATADDRAQTYTRKMGATAEGRASYTPPKGSSDSKKSLVDQIPLDAPRAPVKGEKADSTELGRNIGNAMNALPGIQAVGRIPGVAKTAQKAAGSRAVSTAVDDGVTFLGRSGRRQVGGFDELGEAAKKLADGRKAAITREGGPALANNPTKRIGGPSKGELTARDRAARAAKRQAEMTKDNADRYGLDPKSPDYMDKAKSIRDNLGGSDFSLGMKKGGAVKGWGMARGARKAKIV